MINVTNFLKRSNQIINYIITEKRSRDNFTYWSLYLDDRRTNPREVDTCATSLCISILELIEKNASRNFRSNSDIIQGGINTLIKIRSSDGSWPSIVAPKNIIKGCIYEQNMEVAIADTYYALSALLDAGFLNKNFCYTNLAIDELKDHERRTEFVIHSIKWLIDNTCIEGQSVWYYTNSKDEDIITPTMLTTANIILLFCRITEIFECGPYYEKYKEFIELLKSVTDSSADLMLLKTNNDGGIGKYIITEDNNSLLIHTCKLIDVLILINRIDDIDDLKNALEFVIRKMDGIHFETSNIFPEDSFVEKYTLRINQEDEVSVLHENCIEGIVLNTLLSVLSFQKNRKNICSMIDLDVESTCISLDKVIAMLERNQTREGKYSGAFRSRVNRPEGLYPIYSSFSGYQSVLLYDMFFNKKQRDRMSSETNKLYDRCVSLSKKISETISIYSVNKSNDTEIELLRVYNDKLNAFIEELKNDVLSMRYKEIENAFYSIKECFDMLMKG